MRRDTIFDLASVTKTFTTIAVMQQVEAGRVDLDEPVATYLPAFAENGKDDVTIRHLLTHTGGLPAWLPLYSAYPTVEERLAAVLAVKPTAEPGEAYVYSDLGLITLGLVVEEVTGRPLDAVIARRHHPAAADDRTRCSTRRRDWSTGSRPPRPSPGPDRPMIRGEVHDENAWSLGGVAGHAGLFSTAHDLAVLGRTLLNGGRYGHARILEADTVRAMLVNENAEFPEDSHGLGFELDQRWYMDGLSTPVTFGHTGFTGTSVVIDPMSDSFVILLTNRVHPSRDWGSNNPARRAVARDLARAIAVRPLEGGPPGSPASATPARSPCRRRRRRAASCRSGSGTTPRPATTSSPSRRPPTAARRGHPCRSRWATRHTTDGTLSGFGGRRWHAVTATLPEGDDVLVRWRYANDAANQGRGVYVDRVRVDGTRLPDALFTADGWQQSRN